MTTYNVSNLLRLSGSAARQGGQNKTYFYFHLGLMFEAMDIIDRVDFESKSIYTLMVSTQFKQQREGIAGGSQTRQ